tara:strand:- start:328 stop:486 length:159 start_codon:yes stop_codon:yes gene_type:complete
MLTIIFNQWVVDTTPARSSGGQSKETREGRADIHRDDNEILEILAIAARFLN